MQRWKVKWALQKAMSLSPWPHELNYLFQRFVTRGVVFNERRFEARLERIRLHLDAVRSSGPRAPGDFSVLELGTGWVPAVSIGLALGGAARVTSVDIADHLKPAAVAMVLAWYLRYARAGRLDPWLGPLAPGGVERLKQAQSLATRGQAREALRSLGVEAVVSDIRGLVPPARSGSRSSGYDLIVSDITLEHVPAGELPALLHAFRGLVADDGAMSHLIDFGDHYSYFDKRITPYNFYCFDDAAWERYNTTLLFQNRLRVSDFQRLFEEAGFQVTERRDERPHAEQLRGLPLAPRFRAYPVEVQEVTSAWFLLRPASSPR
ncbi:MAG: class I SAM-dependent methyltransferase [Deltaproteobacteria bacterium]|nr:class I SAM-dependent methyltransferase [Deltaproteobacteria bacterium]